MVDAGGTAPPGLVQRAAALLATGPAHTLEVAEVVLGLRGAPEAASRAVFTLLGSDPRFLVDPSGRWRLDPSEPEPGPALRHLPFAVVDVETTGGAWSRGHRVTEVAVVTVSRGHVEDSLETLVNPGRPIPPHIQGLTGITDRMVASAPPFEGVAPKVQSVLEGRIFVAHNASFDWGFIRGELLTATGEVPLVEQLCTVRLGRLLVPRLRRYNLDALTSHFRIPVHRRHRAHGDALATARLLLRLLDLAEARGIGDLHGLRKVMS